MKKTEVGSCLNNYFSVLQVFIPNIEYNGQKLMSDVSKKTMPIINNIVPNVPVTVCVKYNTPKTIATIILTIRSVDPIFFFMMTNILVKKN
jgi:hypothetical protein